MSNYKKRSDYFKTIATKNLLIAHNQPIPESNNMRDSFHRINSENELNAAVVNWAHFPCVCHIGHTINFRSNGTGLPRRVISNHIYFLTPIDTVTYPIEADAIEMAYAESELAMSQFISYMIEDFEANGSCGNLFLFDANRASAEQIGPINQILYGWYLVFQDEAVANNLKYNPNNWLP